MRKLFPIADNFANRVTYLHLAAFLWLLPFDRFYSELVLVSLLLHTLIHRRSLATANLRNPYLLPVCGIYLLTLAGTPYSPDRDQAFFDWMKQLSLLLFPLLLFVNGIALAPYRNALLRVFLAGCTLTTAYLFWDAFRTIRFYGLPWRSLFTAAFINQNFTEPIGLHPTYFAMYLFMATAFGLHRLLRGQGHRGMTAASLLLLLAGMVQCGSKAVLLALLLYGLGLLPFLYFRRRIRALAIVTLLAAVGLLLLFRAGSYRSRYLHDFRTDLQTTSVSKTADEPRLQRWLLAWQLVKAAPVAGHGAGSEKKLLKETYFDHGLYRSYLAGLNAHNQYLSFLLKGGIVGLLVFLLSLAAGLRSAFRQRDALFLAFLLLVAVVSCGENILDVNKGIFFFGFFFSFFLAIHHKKATPAAPPPFVLQKQTP